LDVLGFLAGFFTAERIMTLLLMIIAIIIWELCKKGARKATAFMVQHTPSKYSLAAIGVIVALIVALFLLW